MFSLELLLVEPLGVLDVPCASFVPVRFDGVFDSCTSSAFFAGVLRVTRKFGRFPPSLASSALQSMFSVANSTRDRGPVFSADAHWAVLLNSSARARLGVRRTVLAVRSFTAAFLLLDLFEGEQSVLDSSEENVKQYQSTRFQSYFGLKPHFILLN